MPEGAPATRRSPRSRRRLIVRAALLAMLVALIAEGLLQLGALLMHERPAARRFHATTRILSVGDSHTYGAGLPDGESYPAHLQVLLDERAPGEFSVINLGLPGMSTTQVRNRLASHVSVYQPDIVIVWCGVNNVWNYSEVVDEEFTTSLAALAYRSRLYRLLKVWRHNREIDRYAAMEGRHQPWERNLTVGERRTYQFEEDGKLKTYTGEPQIEEWKLRRGDEVETIHQIHAPRRIDDAMEARVHDDLVAMVAWLRRAEIPTALVAIRRTSPSSCAPTRRFPGRPRRRAPP